MASFPLSNCPFEECNSVGHEIRICGSVAIPLLETNRSVLKRCKLYLKLWLACGFAGPRFVAVAGIVFPHRSLVYSISDAIRSVLGYEGVEIGTTRKCMVILKLNGEAGKISGACSDWPVAILPRGERKAPHFRAGI